MSDYYSAVNVRRLYTLTRLLGRTLLNYLAPGSYVVLRPPPAKYIEPDPRATRPDPPPPPDNPVLQTDDNDDQAPELFQAVDTIDAAKCVRCGVDLGPDEGLTCDAPRCRSARTWWVCETCHPHKHEPLWCPAHNPDDDGSGDPPMTRRRRRTYRADAAEDLGGTDGGSYPPPRMEHDRTSTAIPGPALTGSREEFDS
jgi:hypothetical protein